MANTTGLKFGGREKGTPNKHTREIREAFKTLIEDNLDNMTEWLNKIAENNPERAIDVLVKLSEFVVPKLSRSEVRNSTMADIMNMTEEERDMRISQLKSKLLSDD